jgi:hypothetical protein
MTIAIEAGSQAGADRREAGRRGTRAKRVCYGGPACSLPRSDIGGVVAVVGSQDDFS